jgi:flavodoxin
MALKKSLRVYYSRKGSNYVGGSIVHLSIGNTEVIARKIQGLTGSDLFQIETVKLFDLEDFQGGALILAPFPGSGD